MLARPEDADKWGRHHADANSRLIAAAPDLLAALESVIPFLEFKERQGVLTDAARAAVAKAKAGGAK